MTPKPAVLRIPSPNYGYPAQAHGRGVQRIVAIVDHIMDGTLAGCDAWFVNPASQVSAHFGVGRSGEIHQYVEEEDAAWGAGVLNTPDLSLPWLPPSGMLVNQRVISIEHEGHPGDAFTPSQMDATIALHRYLIARWSIPVDEEHIIGHYRLDSVNRANCPGAAFPWPAMFAALREVGGEMALSTTQRKEVLANMDVLWGWLNALDLVVRPEIVGEMRSAALNIKRACGLE